MGSRLNTQQKLHVTDLPAFPLFRLSCHHSDSSFTHQISLFALLVHCTALLEYLPSSARYIPLTIVTPWFRDESAGQGIRMRDPSSIIEHRQLLIPSWPQGIAPGPRKRRGSSGIRSMFGTHGERSWDSRTTSPIIGAFTRSDRHLHPTSSTEV